MEVGAKVRGRTGGYANTTGYVVGLKARVWQRDNLFPTGRYKGIRRLCCISHSTPNTRL